MAHNGAPLPESLKDKFEQYVAWAKASDFEEIDPEDSPETIQRARESDPDYVATLMYLGLGDHPMWIVRGFEEPDGDTVERWFIHSTPWPFQEAGKSAERMIEADFLGHCTLCNPQNDDSSDDDCPECSGDGSTEYWFEDYV